MSVSPASALSLILAFSPGLSAQEGAEVLRPASSPTTKDLAEILRRAEASLAAVETGRRLSAVTRGLDADEFRADRLEALRGQALRYLGPDSGLSGARPEVLAADAEAFPALSPLDREFLLVRELARASARVPVHLVEDESAARQTVLVYALEKAGADRDFGRRLRAAYEDETLLIASRRNARDLAGAPFPGPVPKGGLQALAFHLALFAEDPYSFYASVEESPPCAPDAVRLSALEDLLALHAGRLDGASCGLGGRYCLVDGRVYPEGLVRAGLVVRGPEGLSRIREALGPFRTLGAAALSKDINRWLRGS